MMDYIFICKSVVNHAMTYFPIFNVLQSMMDFMLQIVYASIFNLHSARGITFPARR